MSAIHARPRVTIAYRMSAYSEDDILEAGALLSAAADVEAEPFCLTLMGLTAELQVTIALPEALISEDAVSRPVGDALLSVCRTLAEWYRRLEETRDTPPELIRVRLAGRDVKVDLTCDTSPEACLGRYELRAIPAAFREMAPRIRATLDRYAAPVIAVGVHADPECAASARCIIGRFWEIGDDGAEPKLLLDSWRERAYTRTADRGEKPRLHGLRP